MHTLMSPLDVALAYHRAWTALDMDTAMNHVAPDVVFDTPAGTSTGAAALRQFMGPFAASFTSSRLVAAHGSEKDALIIYDTATPCPGQRPRRRPVPEAQRARHLREDHLRPATVRPGPRSSDAQTDLTAEDGLGGDTCRPARRQLHVRPKPRRHRDQARSATLARSWRKSRVQGHGDPRVTLAAARLNEVVRYVRRYGACAANRHVWSGQDHRAR